MSNAADVVALTESNFEILIAEVFKQEVTYVNGVPRTTIGPPTTGSRALDELWKEALGGWWKCTAAGTPGTWKQILPAAVAEDPAARTIPTGYLALDLGTGREKRHAGGYVRESQVGGSASARVGFWGAAPVVQPCGADQAAVTLGNANEEIGGLTVWNPPTQLEVQPLRDQSEELEDDVRALSTRVRALRAAVVAVGVVTRVGRNRPTRRHVRAPLGEPGQWRCYRADAAEGELETGKRHSAFARSPSNRSLPLTSEGTKARLPSTSDGRRPPCNNLTCFRGPWTC